jgi:hypothetical protein
LLLDSLLLVAVQLSPLIFSLAAVQ